MHLVKAEASNAVMSPSIPALGRSIASSLSPGFHERDEEPSKSSRAFAVSRPALPISLPLSDQSRLCIALLCQARPSVSGLSSRC